jgi:hypothetical protein
MGNFVISDWSWPTSGNITAAVWAINHAATEIPVENCGSGSGQGDVDYAAVAAKMVHDIGAMAYQVEVSGFKTKETRSFNGDWTVRLKKAAGGGARWTNGGDAIDRPRVALRIKSLANGAVVCTLRWRKASVEYRLPADRWQPLKANRLPLVRSRGTGAKVPPPKAITVRPA